jgi:competence protein ComEC
LASKASTRLAPRAGGTAALDPIELETSRPPPGSAALAAAIRDGLTRSTEDLGGESGALLRGLTIGDTEGLTATTVDDFRRCGLSHLVAVSGENVAIVLGAILFVAGRLGHAARVVLCGLGLGLFVLIVGPEPSVLRAAAMGGIGLWAVAGGRRAEPLHALGLAVIIVLALRPALVFSVGLQLSVAATAGIVLWTGRVAQRLRFLPSAAALGLGATVAAQAAVAPLLVGTFGQLSLVSPGANMLALPAVPPATVVGLMSGILGVFSGPGGRLVARMAEPFAAWILMVGNKIGDLGWSSVEMPTWSAWLLAAPVVVAAFRALRGGPSTTTGGEAPQSKR